MALGSLSGDLGERGRPTRVALALLGFSITATVFLILPPFFKGDFGWVHGFTGQEAFDLLTPVVTMPFFALAVAWSRPSGGRGLVVLVALISAWVAGQGIHLAANAMGDLYAAGPEREAFYATPVGYLDHFFDEELSHWLWHLAWLGMLGLLLWTAVAARRGAPVSSSTSAIAVGAGILHGVTWFVVTDQGRTWPVSLPAAAVLLFLAWWLRRPDGAGRVVTTFLSVAGLVALAGYGAWIAYAGWPPAGLCERFGC